MGIYRRSKNHGLGCCWEKRERVSTYCCHIIIRSTPFSMPQ